MESSKIITIANNARDKLGINMPLAPMYGFVSYIINTIRNGRLDEILSLQDMALNDLYGGNNSTQMTPKIMVDLLVDDITERMDVDLTPELYGLVSYVVAEVTA